MEVTWKKLHNVTFPVYSLPSEDIRVIRGLVYSGPFLVDDRYAEGETLGVRRLRSTHAGYFRNFRGKIETLTDLISRPGGYYIDHKGKIFKYRKTQRSTVKYHRILRVEGKGTSSLLHLEGVRVPLRVPRPPPHGVVWAGVMYFKEYPWVLYEYSSERKPDARRMF